MISIPIPEIKSFMNHLLRLETFDAFQVTEISLTTYASFHIDGHIQKDYFSKEEYETFPLDDYPLVRWKQFRPICFDLIKGRHTPLAFSIIFQLSRSAVVSFLAGLDIGLEADSVNGLFLNLRYEKGALTAVTGTSLNVFSLDRSLEAAWDAKVQKFILSL